MNIRGLGRSQFIAVSVFIITFMIAGCASRKVKITETGFLSSYAGMKESDVAGKMRVFKDEGTAMDQRYTKVMIAPIQYILNGLSEEHQIEEADKQRLADFFYGRLKEQLQGTYEIVEAPGSDVFILRTAITNLIPNIGVLNINVFSLFAKTGLGGASIEAEAVDSVGGERIMALVDARKGGKFKNGFETWGHAEDTLGFWAEAIVRQLP